MEHEYQLTKHLYHNWVKAGLGLKYLKDGLETFVDGELKLLQNNFLHDIWKEIGKTEATCSACTTCNALKCPTYGMCNVSKRAGSCNYHDKSNPAGTSRNCPNNICHRLVDKIKSQHRTGKPSWKNTDGTQWCTNHWEIAKCFLPFVGYEQTTSFVDTDCSGILTIANNCVHIQTDLAVCVNDDILSKLLTTRNHIFHSATLEMGDDELNDFVGDMIKLLQDKKTLLNDPAAQMAVVKMIEEFQKLSAISDLEESQKRHIDYLNSQSKRKLQTALCSIYEKHLSTIPVSPGLEDIHARVEDIFVELIICDDLIHEPKTLENRINSGKKVEGYIDILYAKDQTCENEYHKFKNVYVIGDAGIGKTTWCMQMLSTWVRACKKKTGQILDAPEFSADERIISQFDVVLYTSLRHATDDGNIWDMIRHQLFVEHPQLEHLTADVLGMEPETCLIVLDGLDEWSPPAHFQESSLLQSPGLPGRKNLNGCTVLTTTRSWKLDAVRLKSYEIDRAVKIQGIQYPYSLAQRIIDVLNEHLAEKSGENKCFEKKVLIDFKRNVEESFHQTVPSFLNVPFILVFIVCIWFDNGTLDTTIAAYYSRVIEFLINHAEGNKKTGKLGRLSDMVILPDLKSKWYMSANSLPDCLKRRRICQFYSELLLKLSSLAFESLFDPRKEHNLVFTADSLEERISDEELEVAVKIGILSQSKEVGKTLTRTASLSFLHTTFQEYLAALHLVCSTQNGDKESMLTYKTYCLSRVDVMEMENIILCVCGMDPHIASEMSSHAYTVAKCNVQDHALKCVREITVAHGSAYPSQSYPVYINNTKVTLTTDDTFTHQLTLLKTNKNRVSNLKIFLKTESNDSVEYQMRNVQLANELQSLQYDGLAHLSLKNIQIESGYQEWLPNALCQMLQLKSLKLYAIFNTDTCHSIPVMHINLTNCYKLEKLQCYSMSSCAIDLNSTQLHVLELNKLNSCTVSVNPHTNSPSTYGPPVPICDEARLEIISCTKTKNCKINLTNTIWKIDRVDLKSCSSCTLVIETDNNDQGQRSIMQNRSVIETIACNSLNECILAISRNVNTNKLNLTQLSSCRVCFKNLQHLDISCLDEMPNVTTQSLLLSLQHATNLQTIICDNKPDSFLQEVFSICVVNFKPLEALEISHEYSKYSSHSTNGSTMFKLITQSEQQPTKIKRIKCTSLSETACGALEHVLKHSTMTYIETLELEEYYQHNIPPSVIRYLQHLPLLRHVSCIQLSGTAWEALGNILPTLTKLEILELEDNYQNKMPDSVVQSLQHLTHLRHLNLICSQLPESTLETLQIGLPLLVELETLTFSYIYIIDVAMINTLSDMHHLKKITLHVQLTDAQWREFIDYQPRAHHTMEVVLNHVDMNRDTVEYISSSKKFHSQVWAEIDYGTYKATLKNK